MTAPKNEFAASNVALPTPDDALAANERGISRLVRPEVALHDARGGNERRHVLRGLVRVGSLAAGDAVAAALSVVAVRAILTRFRLGPSGSMMASVTTFEFCAAMLLAMALAGNYRRSSSGHATSHMLIGSVLGTLIVGWSSLWGAHALEMTPLAVGIAVSTTCALFLTRGVTSAISRLVLARDRGLIPAIVIAADASVNATLDPASGYRVAGTVFLDGRHAESKIQHIARLIRSGRAEALIILGDVRSVFFAHVLEIGLRAGCEVLCTPPGYGVVGVRPTVIRRGTYNLVAIGIPSLKAPQLFAKRIVDIVGATIALVIAMPLCIASAFAIRLESPGPIIFPQERVGIGGRRFRMLKFRTMREGADKEKTTLAHLNSSGDSRLFKIPNDPRVFRSGRFLRTWSFDELPQLLNVIGGSMSLVGPRPFFEHDFADYEEHHFHRLGAKPGITGLWQVFGRSNVKDFEEVVRMDTDYIDNWSLWLDFKILFHTIPAVVRRTGAY